MKNKKFNWRMIIPFIPIIGLVLAYPFMLKYGDTGIEDFGVIFFLSMIVQASSYLLLIIITL